MYSSNMSDAILGRLARSRINIPTQANQAVQNGYILCILYKNHSSPQVPNENAKNKIKYFHLETMDIENLLNNSYNQ